MAKQRSEAVVGNLDQPKYLSDVVTLTRQFQRAVRLDIDFGKVEALQGYICQGTALSVLESTARQIVHSPQRAFTWTGPFGGGKSSLAVALCSLVAPNKVVRQAAYDVLSLDAKAKSDITRAFSATKDGWLVLPVVGHRGNVSDAIATCLDERAGTKILSTTKAGTRQRITAVFNRLTEQTEKRADNGVLLVIDELGKFLEAAAADGDDIYFYQELADLAGRCEGKLVVVGILHQSFEQYAYRLGSELRDEWRKVQGRYIDIPLIAASDEVVELTGRAIYSAIEHPESMRVSKQVADSIRHRRPGLNAEFAARLDRCWPLHPVTAALLGPVSKRRFGQNERSTFGFLASAEARSFREFLHATPVTSSQTYTPAAYWDYLRTNLEPSILASPESHRWAQSVDAVERTEQKQKDSDLHVQLVKTIALIDHFRNGSGLVADEAVLRTCLVADGSKMISGEQIQELLQDLRRWAIITFKRHLGSWSISEGSDFDIDEAVAKELSSIDEPNLAELSQMVRLQPVLAKRHYCETGTLRWMLPIMAHANHFPAEYAHALALAHSKNSNQGNAFGAYLLVLPARGQSVRQAANTLNKLSWRSDPKRPVLVGIPRNGESIHELGRELIAYEQIRRHRSELENDAVARRELASRTTEVRSRLEDELREALINVQWLNIVELGLGAASSDVSKLTLSQLASLCADKVYSKSPHIFSELINRDSPSSNSVKARRDLLYAMLRNASKERLGLEGYPAEAGLYHNLLEASGLHRPTDEEESGGAVRYAFQEPVKGLPNASRAASFVQLWKAATNLVIYSNESVSLTALYELWQSPPYGVRAGVLPIYWLAFLLANQHQIALYREGIFVPQLREVDIDEVLQAPERFSLRYVQLDEHKQIILAGVAKHLRAVGRNVETEPLDAARGLVALVLELPAWSARTQTLSQKTLRVRDTLARANDPHKVLFVDLPILFEGLSVSEYLDELGNALTEMQEAYANMLRRVMSQVFMELGANFKSPKDLDSVRKRASTIAGITGELELDAVAKRLSILTNDVESIESILSLAARKPPRDWTDQDIDAALIQLAQWALKFRQVEVVSSVQNREPTRNAIAVVFGSGQHGKTVSESFDISQAESKHVQEISESIVKQFKNVRREILLAALASAGTQVVESARDIARES